MGVSETGKVLLDMGELLSPELLVWVGLAMILIGFLLKSFAYVLALRLQGRNTITESEDVGTTPTPDENNE